MTQWMMMPQIQHENEIGWCHKNEHIMILCRQRKNIIQFEWIENE